MEIEPVFWNRRWSMKTTKVPLSLSCWSSHPMPRTLYQSILFEEVAICSLIVFILEERGVGVKSCKTGGKQWFLIFLFLNAPRTRNPPQVSILINWVVRELLNSPRWKTWSHDVLERHFLEQKSSIFSAFRYRTYFCIYFVATRQNSWHWNSPRYVHSARISLPPHRLISMGYSRLTD